MKMITIENVTKTYGEKELFKGISFTIGERERVGLIGVNGTGKSSLLRIAAGIDQPDSGEIIVPKDYKISFLSQQPEMEPGRTVLDQVFSGEAPILKLMRDYELVLSELSSNPDN
ncbi:MAG: ATP-binding cassette domain-containing protein, partial [Mesobacillus sp.]|uniref:ATP-binding cassette domain-containing protein n=1 Tax=Mesobacillus sp. TaxID=2675271 RepID=UPI003C3E945C